MFFSVFYASVPDKKNSVFLSDHLFPLCTNPVPKIVIRRGCFFVRYIYSVVMLLTKIVIFCRDHFSRIHLYVLIPVPKIVIRRGGNVFLFLISPYKSSGMFVRPPFLERKDEKYLGIVSLKLYFVR